MQSDYKVRQTLASTLLQLNGWLTEEIVVDLTASAAAYPPWSETRGRGPAPGAPPTWSLRDPPHARRDQQITASQSERETQSKYT